jgi:hypothetical protein
MLSVLRSAVALRPAKSRKFDRLTLFRANGETWKFPYRFVVIIIK